MAFRWTVVALLAIAACAEGAVLTAHPAVGVVDRPSPPLPPPTAAVHLPSLPAVGMAPCTTGALPVASKPKRSRIVRAVATALKGWHGGAGKRKHRALSATPAEAPRVASSIVPAVAAAGPKRQSLLRRRTSAYGARAASLAARRAAAAAKATGRAASSAKPPRTLPEHRPALHQIAAKRVVLGVAHGSSHLAAGAGPGVAAAATLPAARARPHAMQ